MREFSLASHECPLLQCAVLNPSPLALERLAVLFAESYSRIEARELATIHESCSAEWLYPRLCSNPKPIAFVELLRESFCLRIAHGRSYPMRHPIAAHEL